MNAEDVARGHFQIGDAVEIVPSDNNHHWTHDWVRMPLWIAGVDWCPTYGVSYTVTDKWPLPKYDYRGCLTDGFAPTELCLRVAALLKEE